MSASDEAFQYRFNTSTSVLEYHHYGTGVPIRKNCSTTVLVLAPQLYEYP